MPKKRYVQIVSLGCAKNLVDTEVMAADLATKGFYLTNDNGMADVCLINTCSFVHDARDEAEAEIKHALRWRKKKRGRKVVVSGCLPQKDPERVRKQFPDVDLLIGLDDVPNIASLLDDLLHGNLEEHDIKEKSEYLYDEETPRLQLTPQSFAYVKIAEGCDHRCTFCTIPAIRGDQRSRSIASIVKECQGLIKNGVKELNLIAQDTTRYGRDREDGANLIDLLAELDKIKGDFWLRLLYTHPRYFPKEDIKKMAEFKHLVPYVDIPLQHISDPVLQKMGRRMDEQETRELMDQIRQDWPKACIRTTFIVGFPGETEEDFNKLLEYIKEFKFERVGVFTYSPEAGTPAVKLPDHVPAEIAEERKAILLETQQQISLDYNSSMIDTVQKVIVEGMDEEGLYIGRTTADAPDIDNLVHFDSTNDNLGFEFVNVRIDQADVYDIDGIQV